MPYPSDTLTPGTDTEVHGWADPSDRRLRTVPNLVTLIRTVVSLVLAGVALDTGSAALIVAAYGAYWLGDMADGALARRLGQETRRGAVFDILCDRACTIACGVAVIAHFAWTAPAVIVFLAQFVLVDTPLTLLFLRWPLLSPNYFHLVDRVLYRWNWSPPAKAVNTASVVLVTAVSGSGVAGTVVAAVVLVAKTLCLRRGIRLARAR